MATIYYHFTGSKLRDGAPIPRKRRWLVFDGTPVPCERGLHASPDPFDALQYAPGNTLHQVQLGGTIVEHGKPVDKFAAQKRKIVASIDATDTMRLFARRVALDVIHLWDAPPIVREFLETGDPSKAANAYAANAANAAANAANAAANANAANAAANAYAANAYAANAANAAYAAYAAKKSEYRLWFNEMVYAAFAMQKAQVK